MIESTKKDYKGHTIEIKWYQDEDCGRPWEIHEGHGPVREGRTDQKEAGEYVLSSQHGRGWLYDFAGAVRIARRDKWGISPESAAELAARLNKFPEELTPGEIADEAAKQDFNLLRKWLRDEWFWVYYNIKIRNSEGLAVYSDSLSGIDSTSMKEFEEEAFSDAQEWLDREVAGALDYAC